MNLRSVLGTAWTVNLKRLGRRPLRPALTAAAIAAGVSLAIAVSIVSGSLMASWEEYSRRLAGPAPLRIVGAADRGGLDEATLQRVQSVPGVETAVPVVQAVALARDRGGREVVVVALGIDCRAESSVGAFGCGGGESPAGGLRFPVISERLTRLVGPGRFMRTDLGRVPIQDSTALRQLNELNGGRIAVFPLPVAQHLFSREGRYDVIYIKAEQGAELAELHRRIAAAAGPQSLVLGRTEIQPGFLSTGPLLPLLGVVSVAALGLGGLLVYNAVSLSFRERRRDLAVVGAVGGTAAVVLGGALVEAGILGLVGGILGVAGGTALSYPLVESLSSVMEPSTGLVVSLYLTPGIVIVGIALGVLVGSLGSLPAGWRAARADVAAEIHGRAERAEAAPILSFRRGIAFAVLGHAFVGFCYLAQRGGALEPWQPPLGSLGLLGSLVCLSLAGAALAPLLLLSTLRVTRRFGGIVHLAVAGLVRDPRRTSVLVLTVGAAVGLASLLGSLSQAVQQSVGSSLLAAERRVWVSALPVYHAANIEAGVPPRVLDQVESVPGVARVDRHLSLRINDRSGRIAVLATEGVPRRAHKVVEGTADASVFGGGDVIVGTTLARRQGLRPGSFLRIPGRDGVVRLRVAGIWEIAALNGNAVMMSLDQLTAIWGPKPLTALLVSPERGVSEQELAARIEAAPFDPDLRVLTIPEVSAVLSSEIEAQTLPPFWALQRGLLLVAFVASLSTLLLAGVQRRREMGLLAAVGAGPGRLGRLTLIEAGIIGALGSLFGSLGSLPFAEAVREVNAIHLGVRVPFNYDATVPLVYGVVATLVVIAGALLPAWRASRLPVVEALRYE